MRRALSVGVALAALAIPSPASAFCGFYVSGGGAKLFNNATQVVLMRDGMRTVLSMQNNYQGPPEAFAMVVPVPVVLQKENVKTLPKAVFEHIDNLDSPRLVEYWEQDPCYEPPTPKPWDIRRKSAPVAVEASPQSAASLGVKVEAEFTVGEYEVVVLSAKDAGGLDAWLKQNSYKIPEGSEPYFKPYIEQGSKFFVAKVDPTKVKFENGMATLSPLRFHYDSDRFSLPVRLGLVNAQGAQDLIVHILAKHQRYEVANYPNVTIPTNLDVSERALEDFGPFYVALFDKTVEKHPKAVVTEYSWQASSCDPCPGPAMAPEELKILGGDVLPNAVDCSDPMTLEPSGVRRYKPGCEPWASATSDMVVTRLHARYTKDSLGEDLVFKAAEPITGGREIHGGGGKLEEGAVRASMNNFQARYAVRHPWTGPVECKSPRRGIWGANPKGSGGAPKSAKNLAFAPRGKVELASVLRSSVPELSLQVPTPPPPPSTSAPTTTSSSKCGCEVVGDGSGGSLAAIAFGAVATALGLRRRRSS